MKVWRTIDNFLSKEEIAKVFTEKSFKPFTVRWHTLPSKSFYQNKILQEIKNDFTDLSSAIGIEEWHQDADWFLPEEHIDKDEALYKLAKKYRGCLWVEDKVENAYAGDKVQFESIVMEHGYNMNDDHPFFVAKDWEDIYLHISKRK